MTHERLPLSRGNVLQTSIRKKKARHQAGLSSVSRSILREREGRRHPSVRQERAQPRREQVPPEQEQPPPELRAQAHRERRIPAWRGNRQA